MDNNKRASAYELFKSELKKLPKSEKLLLITQAVLSITIITIVLLLSREVISQTVGNLINLSLLFALLIVSAIRIFPRRKGYAIAYLVIALFILYLAIAYFL